MHLLSAQVNVAMDVLGQWFHMLQVAAVADEEAASAVKMEVEEPTLKAEAAAPAVKVEAAAPVPAAKENVAPMKTPAPPRKPLVAARAVPTPGPGPSPSEQ